MNSTNQGLKFGFFESLGPEDQELIFNSLRTGSSRLELYWEKPGTRIKCHLPRATVSPRTNLTTTATQTSDGGLHNRTEPEPAGALVRDAGDGLAVPPPCTHVVAEPADQPSTTTTTSNLPEPTIHEQVIPEHKCAEEQIAAPDTAAPSLPVAPENLQSVPAANRAEVDKGGHGPAAAEWCDVPRDTKQPSPAALIDNYFPPPPPPQEQQQYLPPMPPQQVGVVVPPPGLLQHERSPPASVHQVQQLPPPSVPRSSHQPDYSNVQRRSEADQQQVRGHVEDGIYTRPSSNAQNLPSPAVPTAPLNPLNNPLNPLNNSLGLAKPYERRNKKRRPPDYYTRYEMESNPTQQQVPQVVNAYHPGMPAVSVRPAMEPAPGTGTYVGHQQGSPMSSHYGQQTHMSYPLITSIMNPMHQQAVTQMHLFPRQHQPQVATSPPQTFLLHQQQELARMMANNYPYLHQHVAQNAVFHQQPQVGPGTTMTGMAQPPTGRPVAMSPSAPSGLSPSMQPQMGRSPPRGPPTMAQQFQDPRSMEQQHHGYHQQHPQASPNVPMNHAPQVAIQTLNSSSNFNQCSANIQKDVARTGGQRMPCSNVIMSPPQPQQQNIASYVPPPPPQPHGQMVQPQPVPQKVAAAPPPPVTGLVASKPLDTQHQAMAPGNQKAPAAPAPQPDAKPVSPEALQSEGAAQPVVVEGPVVVSSQTETNKSSPNIVAPVGPNDTRKTSPLKFMKDLDSVNIVMDNVDNDNSGAPLKSGEMITEKVKDKEERTSTKASFGGLLTFGTVQDIATMNAQSTEVVGVKYKTNEECTNKKMDNVAPPPNTNTLPKAAPKTQATAPVVSVETIKAVAEPVEEFHDAPLPPEDLKEKPVAVVQPQPTPAGSSSSSGAAPTAPTPATNNTTTGAANISSPPVQNTTPSSPPTSTVHKQSEPTINTTKQSEAKSGASDIPSPVAVPPAVVAEPIKPKVVWASLFKSETKPAHVNAAPDPQPSHITNAKPARKSEEKDDKKPVPIDEDSKARKLGEFLSKYVNKYSPVSLQPRGLYNRSNWCYINATLQALLACPAFYQLMKAMPHFIKPGSRGPTSTPVIDCISQFVNEFTEMAPQNLKYIEKSSGKGPQRSNIDIRYGQPFLPVNVLKMLDVIQSSTSFKLGRQEDAEEFLGVLLNALHEEMVACINITRNGKEDEKAKENGDVAGNGNARDGTANENEDDDDQWEQVGPKNKSVVTRSAKLSHSPISETFGGQLRSTVHQLGHKESCTLQPFFSLQLDIQSEKVTSVPEALEALASKETLHGYTNDNKQEVEAYRRYTMDELPPVLILHLKCFIYQKTGGVQKVSKQIDVPMELNIGKDLMSANAKSKYSQSKRVYELFSVVNHHGMRAIGGHYTAYIYHSGIQAWVHLDDSTVQLVSQQKVMQYEPTRFPYLLYYRRKDLT